MDSEKPSNPPIIDFSSVDLKSGTSVWQSTQKQVKSALEDHGFFLVNCDAISSELINAMYLVMEEFYDLPTDKKSQFTSDKLHLGYFRKAPQLPFEITDIGDSTRKEIVEGFTNLMWSSEMSASFGETLHSYSKQVADLEKMILRMVFGSYGLEKYYESHKESTTYICRINKYRAVQMNKSNIEGLIPHSDMSFLTILHQNKVNGLEVKSNDGEWIPVDFPASAFAVIAGDALMAWSSGRIRSRVHRVIMAAEVPRFSIAMFSYKDGTVQAPEELVDDQHPLQFKPFDHFELISVIYERKLIGMEDRLKFLCGT